jgi:hypothetical protein
VSFNVNQTCLPSGVADHKIVGRVPQASPFCPNIAATLITTVSGVKEEQT